VHQLLFDLVEVDPDDSARSTHAIAVQFAIVNQAAHCAITDLQVTRFECWDTDEPSERGIDGIERMRLVRDDIAGRVADLLDRVQTRSS
jgi:hypothetical protein